MMGTELEIWSPVMADQLKTGLFLSHAKQSVHLYHLLNYKFFYHAILFMEPFFLIKHISWSIS